MATVIFPLEALVLHVPGHLPAHGPEPDRAVRCTGVLIQFISRSSLRLDSSWPLFGNSTPRRLGGDGQMAGNAAGTGSVTLARPNKGAPSCGIALALRS